MLSWSAFRTLPRRLGPNYVTGVSLFQPELGVASCMTSAANRRHISFFHGVSPNNRSVNKQFVNRLKRSNSLFTKETYFCGRGFSAVATFDQGLVRISVPLISREESCVFTLKPISSTVGDFLEALKAEDRGIETAGIYTEAGERVAASTPIHSVLNREFDLRVNDKKVDIEGLEGFQLKLNSDVDDRLDEVKRLIAQLYTTLNITDHQTCQEQLLLTQLESLRSEMVPLEAQKADLAAKSHNKTKKLTWMGLGLMGIQFGFLARLTWWEYSWDVMEPVTYFVTYGTIVGMYAYYCVTQQEYEFSKIYNRQFLKTFYVSAKKKTFDVEAYNKLCDDIKQVESDLLRLQDPLQKNLPLSQPK